MRTFRLLLTGALTATVTGVLAATVYLHLLERRAFK